MTGTKIISWFVCRGKNIPFVGVKSEMQRTCSIKKKSEKSKSRNKERSTPEN